MPNIKSAKKRCKVTQTKSLQNKIAKTELKTSIKKFDAAIASNDNDLISKTYKDAVKTVDKAASNNVIHKNNAANKKSALTLKLNKATAK